VKRVG